MSDRTIHVCIPFVGTGIIYLNYFINNILKTAEFPKRIKIILSCHSEEERSAFLAQENAQFVESVILSPAYPNSVMFYPSANHSRAINNLAQQRLGEIAIFSDYDMAFLMKGWDTYIENQLLSEGQDLIGVAYPTHGLHLKHEGMKKYIPSFETIPLFKYQKIPNLSFFAIRTDILHRVFNSQLTDFHNFLKSGSIPWRLINTPETAATNNLPLGVIQWLDTGWEIPHIIQINKLKYKTLEYKDIHRRIILGQNSIFSQLPVIFQPEVFYQPDNPIPFLAHFKKGTAKSGTAGSEDQFKLFTLEVESAINNSLSLSIHASKHES